MKHYKKLISLIVLLFFTSLSNSINKINKIDLIHSFRYSDDNVVIKFLNQDSCCDENYEIKFVAYYDTLNGEINKFIKFNNNKIYYSLEKNQIAKPKQNIDSIISKDLKNIKYNYRLYPRLELALIINEKGEVLYKGQGFIRKDLLELHHEFFKVINKLDFEFEPAKINGKPVASLYYYDFSCI